GLVGQAEGVGGWKGAEVGAVLVDHVYLADTDFLVDARTLLLDGRRGSHRTTNGRFLLMLLTGSCPMRRGQTTLSTRRIVFQYIRPSPAVIASSAPTGKGCPHADGKFFGKNTIELQWQMRTNYNGRPGGGEENAAGEETMANNEKKKCAKQSKQPEITADRAACGPWRPTTKTPADEQRRATLA